MTGIRFGSTMALSFAMVGLIAAQAQPPASQTPPPAAPAPEVTVVGCLAQSTTAADAYTVTVVPAAAADAGVAGPADAAASDAARATAGAARPDAARTAARPATPAAAAATYRIVGIAADQLKPHVNHQVELKGRINAAVAESAAGAQADAAKEFRASAVKMLNATCPAAK